MPNGKEFPPLFDFTREGERLPRSLKGRMSDLMTFSELSVRPDLIRQLVPPQCEPELASRSIVLDGFVPIPLEELKITLD